VPTAPGKTVFDAVLALGGQRGGMRRKGKKWGGKEALHRIVGWGRAMGGGKGGLVFEVLVSLHIEVTAQSERKSEL